MSLAEVTAEIHRLSERRQRLWVESDPECEVPRLSAQLATLYEERRLLEAHERSGPPAEILKRARIESELERLAS